MEEESSETWKCFQDALLSKNKGEVREFFEGKDANIELIFKIFKMDSENKSAQEKKKDEETLQCNEAELDGLSSITYGLKHKKEAPFIFEEILNALHEDRKSCFQESSWRYKYKSKFNILNGDGLPVLCMAIENDDMEAMKSLIGLGVELSFQFEWSQSDEKEAVPIDYVRYSIICGAFQCFDILSSTDDQKIKWDKNGKLPVHFALKYGSLQMVQHVLKYEVAENKLLSKYIETMEKVREPHTETTENSSADESESNSQAGEREEEESVEGDTSNPQSEHESMYSNESDSDETNLSESMDEGEMDEDEEITLNDMLALQEDMREAGFEISRDSSGNIIARLISTEDEFGSGLSSMEEKERGSNAFHLSVQNKDAAVLDFLLTTCSSAAGIGEFRSDGMSPFLIAVRGNDVEKMKMLASAKADISYTNILTGCSAVHIACEVGAKEALDYLISAGLDVNARDNSRYTPLHYIAAGEKGINCLEALLSGGASTNYVSLSEESALYIAISYWNLDAFWGILKAGADPWKPHSDGTVVLGFIAANSMAQLSRFCDYLFENKKIQSTTNLDIVIGEHGQTALHFAALKLSSKSVQSLLKAGANPNSKDLNGSTPIQYAIESIEKDEVSAKDIVSLLLQHGASLESLNEEVSTAFRFACLNGFKDLLQNIFSNGGRPTFQEGTKSILHIACENGNEDIVEVLLKENISLETKDADGYTALLLCAKHHFVSGANLLLDAGANVKAVNSNGDTAIHICSDRNSGKLSDMIEVFMKHDAPTETKNSQGIFPIHQLVMQKQADGLSSLIKFGKGKINLQKLSEDHKTPLMCACENGFMDGILELFKAGVDVNFRNEKGHNSLFFFPDNEDKAINILNFLINQKGDIGVQDSDGDTILHEATLRGSSVIAKFLLLNGSKIDVRNKKGETAIFQAAKHGFKELVKIFLDNDLPEGAADVRIADNEGATPFKIARKMEQSEIVNIILSYLKIDLSNIAPVRTYSPDKLNENEEQNNSAICAICQENISVGESVRALPCSHLFHDECLLQWLGGEKMKNNTTCPICKRHVTPEDI